MSTITLKPQPCSSYFTIPKLGDRRAELFSYAELQGTDDDGNDEYTDDDVQIDFYTSPIDGRVFKFKTIFFDMDHWTEEQIEDFYAEWNNNIDCLILLNP